MRISNRSLGLYVPGVSDFVPASFAVPQNPIIPGLTGLEDFVPAMFALPQNPIIPGLTGLKDFVPAMFTLPENPIIPGLTGVGDMVGTAAMYPIAQNSVLQASGLGDCGCGCGGDCGGGLGGVMDDFSTFVSDQWTKITSGDVATIALWGAASLTLVWFLFGRHGKTGSAYRSAKSDLRKKYREQLRSLRSEFPSTAGRARRAAAAF